MHKHRFAAAEVLAIAPVMPVVTIEEVSHAVPLARALLAGGIGTMEITLRTPAALPAIAAVAREVPGMVVGAGTVNRVVDLAAAIQAGAMFALSPGMPPDLARAARQANIPFIPGIATPTEILTGMEMGFDCFKFFPAEILGGAAALTAICAPLPQVLFCPTGGIGIGKVREYLAVSGVACVGGSWVAPKELLRLGDWSRIQQLAMDAAAFRRPA